MKKWIIPVLLSGLFFWACKKNTTPTNQACNYDPCAVKAPDAEVQKYKDTLNAHGIVTANLTQHCSGLLYQIIDTGKGIAATPCSTVTINYDGHLNDSLGARFDSSTFTTNVGLLIYGFVDGIPLIKNGGHIHLFVPPTLGYGSQAFSTIPANSNLYFDVHLTNVQ